MSKGQSLQEPFLNALRRERVPVSIYLVNGIKLRVAEEFRQPDDIQACHLDGRAGPQCACL